MGALLVILFIVFVAIGVPISFALGVVSFTGIMSMPTIPNTVVFTKMFNGMNSFTLLAVPLFILAANLMNEGDITDRLVACSNALVGRFRGGLAYSNVLVSMVFGGISGSSQADTAGIGSIGCRCHRSILYTRVDHPSEYHHGCVRGYRELLDECPLHVGSRSWHPPRTVSDGRR